MSNIPMNLSKTGMKAFQSSLDVLAQDIANVNTTAYKGENISFQELLLNSQNASSSLLLADGMDTADSAIGAKSSVTSLNMSQGSLQESGRSLDVAISGDGFFQVLGTDGTVSYTRDGAFQLDAAGNLINSAGDRIAVDFAAGYTAVPSDELTITESGEIYTKTAAGTSRLVGTIPVYTTANPQNLTALGGNQYLAANGTVMTQITPGTTAGTLLHQGYLEASNVDLADKLSEMIITQRAYSMNAKALQTADEIMSITNSFNN